MLGFMRRNAQTIVYTIVIAFGLSLFAGIFFYRSLEQSFIRPTQDMRELSIAEIGDLFVLKSTFYQNLDKSYQAQNFGEQSIFTQDPLLLDYIYTIAMQESIRESVLKAQASKQSISLTKKQKRDLIELILQQSGFESLAALKKQLKSNGFSKKETEIRIQEFIEIQALMSSLRKAQQITPEDVPYANTRVNLDLVIIPQDEQISQNENQQRLIKIQKSLLSGKSVEEIKKEYPEVKTRFLSWLNFFELDPSYRKVVFNLGLKEWSNPITKLGESHIIKVLEKDTSKSIVTLEEENAKETLENLLVNQQISKWVEQATTNQNPIFYNPILDVVYSKSRADKSSLEMKYEKLISTYPSVPSFYLSFARYYSQNNDLENAKTWYQKADVVGDLDISLALPQVNIEFAEILKNGKKFKEAQKHYDRAIERAQYLNQFEYLASFFKENKDSVRLKKVNASIDALKKLAENKVKN